MAIAYVDTSAFIKRFLLEDGSSEMDSFAQSGAHRLAISSLTITEFRSVMKRRLRERLIDQAFVQAATGQLLQEIASGALRFHGIDAATFNLAGELIDTLASPLATLDALHLACAKATGAALLVSADRQLLQAAREATLPVLDLTAPA